MMVPAKCSMLPLLCSGVSPLCGWHSVVWIIPWNEEEEETLSLADASEMIYPNPSKGIININMLDFKEATIYNFSGQEVLRSKASRIDLSELSEGVYIIKLEDRSGVSVSSKLVKE